MISAFLMMLTLKSGINPKFFLKLLRIQEIKFWLRLSRCIVSRLTILSNGSSSISSGWLWRYFFFLRRLTLLELLLLRSGCGIFDVGWGCGWRFCSRDFSFGRLVLFGRRFCRRI